MTNSTATSTTTTLKDRIDEIATRYAQRRSAIMPALHLIQAEQGYISRQSMEQVADILDIAPVQVYEIAAFYHQFHTKPIGKHHLQVCTNVSCMLMGAEDVVNHLESNLNIKCGETTKDGKFTLSSVECLGSCDTAPVMQINNEAYCEHLSEKEVDNILQTLKNHHV